MCFDPCNHSMKIWKSIGILTPKVGVNLGMWRFIPSLSYTPENMRCDTRASFLAHTLTSPCLGHKPKARVVTLFVIKVGYGFKYIVVASIEKLWFDFSLSWCGHWGPRSISSIKILFYLDCWMLMFILLMMFQAMVYLHIHLQQNSWTCLWVSKCCKCPTLCAKVNIHPIF